jgi:xanthine dehydrogenase accessory factor
MREIINDITQWKRSGIENIATATVVATWGSAPRGVGSKMAMTADHAISGSVSGGCIEGAVFEAGAEAMETGSAQLLQFGVADETAFEKVGLACGGTVDVFVERLTPQVYEAWRNAAEGEYGVAIATVIAGSGDLIGRKVIVADQTIAPRGQALPLPSTDDSMLERALFENANRALREGRSQRIALSTDQTSLATPIEVFIDVQLPSPTLIIIGGVHIALALTQIAQTLGYRTIVIDPRAAFGNRLRFPNIDELVKEWPREAFKHLIINRSTAIVTLTHDAKFDDQALKIALPSQAFYVGALGGKTTRAKRRERLLAGGMSVEQVDRLHAPIGIDIGSKTPEEIALATMAQIVKVRNAA